MNTPRQHKRFDLERWRSAYWSKFEQGSGHFGLGLVGAEPGAHFALLVTEFTHLEFAMERFLGQLLRVDAATAAHVMRSIISAKARLAMMRAVLERARHTASKPKDFDEILDEFASINKARNSMVHARWFSDLDTGKIYIIRPNDDPMLLDHAAMVEFDIGELEAVRERISRLGGRVLRVVGEDIVRTLPTE